MKTRHTWFIVPLAVPVFTTLHYLAALFFPWVSASIVGPFLGFILVSTVFGGWGSSLVGAGILSAYVLIETDYDPWRTGQLIFFSTAGAVLSVTVRQLLIKWHAEAERNRYAANLIDAANGNLGKLKEIHLDSIKLVDAWKSLNDAAKFEVVNNIRGNLGHVLTIWEGWHALFQEKEAVKWENLRQKLEGKNGD